MSLRSKMPMLTIAFLLFVVIASYQNCGSGNFSSTSSQLKKSKPKGGSAKLSDWARSIESMHFSKTYGFIVCMGDCVDEPPSFDFDLVNGTFAMSFEYYQDTATGEVRRCDLSGVVDNNEARDLRNALDSIEYSTEVFNPCTVGSNGEMTCVQVSDLPTVTHSYMGGEGETKILFRRYAQYLNGTYTVYDSHPSEFYCSTLGFLIRKNNGSCDESKIEEALKYVFETPDNLSCD